MTKSGADAFALALSDTRDLNGSYEAFLSKHTTTEIEIEQLNRRVEILAKANAVRLPNGADVNADVLRVMPDKLKAADKGIK